MSRFNISAANPFVIFWHSGTFLPENRVFSLSCSYVILPVICAYGTETPSTLRRWSLACRVVWTHVAFGHSLYSVRDCGTLCLDCCVTLATTLLALVILWRHSFSQSTSAYSALGALAIMHHTNLRFTYLLFTYFVCLIFAVYVGCVQTDARMLVWQPGRQTDCSARQEDAR